MAAGLIPDGHVDSRPIQEVQPEDLSGFTQCHFFAGLGGWAYAARLAGWPDYEPIWSGSLPCQPFSIAGKRKGTEDERHLWPEFSRLISQCNPPSVWGEQVASKDGRLWLSGVRSDLEALGYAVWATDSCSAGVGAPHIRQRLYWMAFSNTERFEREGVHLRRWRSLETKANESRTAGGMGNAISDGAERPRGSECQPNAAGEVGRLGDSTREQMGIARQPWEHFDVVHCLDGKTRRVKPGLFPLASGVSARVHKLRALGNAITAPLAAEFIKASIEAIRDLEW